MKFIYFSGDLDPTQGRSHLDGWREHFHHRPEVPGPAQRPHGRVDPGHQVRPGEGRRHLRVPNTFQPKSQSFPSQPKHHR